MYWLYLQISFSSYQKQYAIMLYPLTSCSVALLITILRQRGKLRPGLGKTSAQNGVFRKIQGAIKFEF